MKVLWAVVLSAVLALPLQAESKEADRLRNAGTVLREILNVPDDLPQQLLDKSEFRVILNALEGRT